MSEILSTVESRSDAQKLLERYETVRGVSERICEPLSAEDSVIQSMPDVSPTRWHLAHTTWFFETFLLGLQADYKAFNPDFAYLFNSYYNTMGEQFPRAQRGLLSRPGLKEVFAYRRHVDQCIAEVLRAGEQIAGEVAEVLEIGLNHEQQHQELMFTDIKHVLSCNPTWPVYRDGESPAAPAASGQNWVSFDEGIYAIGHEGDGFAYDNESPRHRVFLESFELNHSLVTCGDYLEFMADDGYLRPELWLSLGWQTVCDEGWHSPLYWAKRDNGWQQFTLAGLRAVELYEPVCHVSFFEADAFARWAGKRLPTEAEWEVASEQVPVEGNFADVSLDNGLAVHPTARSVGSTSPSQMFGDVWEWTASPYVAYPGYQAPDGALGEYNGKFMCNQYVLRGGSCATPLNHVRRTYRNFFPPETRWQFGGIRLAG